VKKSYLIGSRDDCEVNCSFVENITDYVACLKSAVNLLVV